MRAGKLRHRVTIQQLVEGSPQRLSNGELDADWGTFLTAWAEVNPVSGREFFAAQAIEHEADVSVRMRYRSGVTTQMRMMFRGEAYDIRAVLNREERNIELLLLCKRGANEG